MMILIYKIKLIKFIIINHKQINIDYIKLTVYLKIKSLVCLLDYEFNISNKRNVLLVSSINSLS